MPVTIDGTNGITNGGGYTGDGVSFADATPANTLVTTTGGNVGIGTSSPSQKLDVSGVIKATVGSNTIYLNPAFGGGAEQAVQSAGPLLLCSNNNERMRITSAGYVGIGGTPQGNFHVIANTNGTLLVRGAITAAEGTSIYSVNAANNTVKPLEIVGSEINITGGEVRVGSATDQGGYNLQCNGTGVWGAGAYVNGSDRNLKDEIAPIGSCLDLVNALNPVTFRYKEEYSKDQATQPGFIAQELQEALADQPYLEGIVQAGPKHLNVAYQTLIPVLTKALQEANAKIDALEFRLAAIEGAIA